QAATLYRGDLLDGFVIDEEPFEQWLVHERERLRELALDALARLLRHQNSLEATDAATQTARRLLTLHPLQEAVHGVLMQLHVRAGRREAALRQYEVCVGLLRRELQLGPEPGTRQLYEEILRTRERAPASVELLAQPVEAAPVERERATEAATKSQNGGMTGQGGLAPLGPPATRVSTPYSGQARPRPETRGPPATRPRGARAPPAAPP